ncbi:hypothetical protein RI103_31650 [Paraburkholderia sp. FT54]|uniref:hypothetical protein n=1 Tax=Paraburkholderia sp. FT54 TaxID=3074437 RepID=UPI002877D85D|nr:hypothetical protein [Paraburkholderia sp. FT54]WNC92770.1 hypothetical protein RI103_31650 [Paraburkholderia sp. FT54]
MAATTPLFRRANRVAVATWGKPIYKQSTIVFRKNFNYRLFIGSSTLWSCHLLMEMTMNPLQFDAGDSAHHVEIQAQLCAYNAAFDELGLRFRWDAQTLALLAMIEGEQAQIAAYIEAHHAHLLKAYSAEFLSQAILEKKRARYPAPLPRRIESAPRQSRVVHQSEMGNRRERMSYEVDLPALAGV